MMLVIRSIILLITFASIPKCVNATGISCDSIPSSQNTPLSREDSAFYAGCCHDHAKSLFASGDLSGAISFAKEAVSYRSELNDTLNLRKSLFNLGFFLRLGGYTQSAIKVYTKLIELTSDKDKIYEKSHTEMGACYITTGDFHKAILYLELASEISKKSHNLRSLYKTYLELSRVYAIMDPKTHEKKVLGLLDKVDSIGDLTPIDARDQIVVLQRKGNIYDETQSYDQAIRAYYKALQISQIDPYQHCVVLNNLAISEGKTNDYSNSSKHLQSAEVIGNDINAPELTALIANNQGDLMMDMNNPDSALYYYQKSISLFVQSTCPSSFQLPDTSALKNAPYKSNLITSLISLSDYWWHRWTKEGNPDYLKKNLTILEKADYLFDLLFYESLEYDSKLFWRSQASQVYGKALRTCFVNQDFHKAYYFMERNKALLLMANLSKKQAMEKAQIPLEFIEREASLHREAIHIRQELAKRSTGELSITDSLSNNLFRYQAFKDSLKKNYPIYKKYLESIPLPSLGNHLKSISGPGRTDLLYLTTPSEVFTLMIRKDTILLTKINLTEIENLLEAFLKLGSDPINSTSQLSEYADLSFRLYQKLLGPFIPFIPTESKIHVSPDGVLQNLNFEALNTSDEPSRLNESFLVRKYEFSYVYSFEHQKMNNNRIRSHNKETIFFTPGEFRENHLPPLPGTIAEGKEINARFGGIQLFASQCTKEKLLESLTRYQIVHIATHANLNEAAQPTLYLHTDQVIYNEFYPIGSQADLVVLSACQTSRGRHAAGEGMMSLARALLYSGVNEVIATLGSINDKSSGEIMIGLYQNLQSTAAGGSLRQAKLSYLDHASGSSISPYYWANFVIFGMNDETEGNSPYTWFLLPGAIVAFAISYWVWKRKASLFR